MGNLLGHGSGLEVIFWVMILAGWLVLVVLGGLIVSLVVAGALALLVRKRLLFWLAPVLTVAVFMLTWRWLPMPPGTRDTGLEVLLKRMAGVLVGVGAVVSAALAAGVAGVAGGAGKIREQPSMWGVEPVAIGTGPPPPPVAAHRASWWKEFKKGLATPVEGFLFMKHSPGLWKYAVLPIVVNLLITAMILLIFAGAAAWFAVWLHPRFPAGVWGAVLEVLAAVGLLIVALGLAMGAWVVLGGVISGHFYAKLARRVEMRLGMRQEEMSDVPLRYQVADALRDLGALIVINGGLLLLNFVPVIGSIVAFPLGVYLDGFVLGYDYVDLPMSLRGMRRESKRARAKAHRWEVAGLGASVIGLNFVPVVGSVLLATAAAGAVLMHRRWEGSLVAVAVR